jgi:hypothetical protein
MQGIAKRRDISLSEEQTQEWGELISVWTASFDGQIENREFLRIERAASSADEALKALEGALTALGLEVE